MLFVPYLKQKLRRPYNVDVTLVAGSCKANRHGWTRVRYAAGQGALSGAGTRALDALAFLCGTGLLPSMVVLRSGILLQLLRYGISGAGLALVFALVYESVLHCSEAGPQLANALAFLVTLVLGYVIHSRWSFRDHGTRMAPLRSTTRFLVVNLASFALNIFWVWLLVKQIGLSSHLPLVPILGVTPWLSFWFNRQWTFG